MCIALAPSYVAHHITPSPLWKRVACREGHSVRVSVAWRSRIFCHSQRTNATETRRAVTANAGGCGHHAQSAPGGPANKETRRLPPCYVAWQAAGLDVGCVWGGRHCGTHGKLKLLFPRAGAPFRGVCRGHPAPSRARTAKSDECAAAAGRAWCADCPWSVGTRTMGGV